MQIDIASRRQDGSDRKLLYYIDEECMIRRMVDLCCLLPGCHVARAPCPVTSRSAAPPRASTAAALRPETAFSSAKPTTWPAGLLATMTTLALEIRKVLLSPYAVSLKVRPASEHPRSATNRHRALRRRSRPPGFANTEHGQTPIHARQRRSPRPCSMPSSSVPMRSRCSSRLVRDTAVTPLWPPSNNML